MSEKPEKLLEKAEYLTDIERWNEAIPLLLKSLAINPEHFQANCLLALCYYSLKDYGNALRFAEKAVAVAPDEEWGHRLRSLVLSEQGKNKEALEAAREAARLAPYEPFALQVLANAYLSLNQTQQARETAEKMREMAPESPYSFFTLGNVFLERGSNYEAEQCFRDALRLNPNFADARNNLGVALLRQKENDRGLFKSSNLSLFQTDEKDDVHWHFTEAMKLEPHNETAAENLRNQFDYFIVLYGFLIFVPFLTIIFFVAPGMAIVSFLIGIFSLFKAAWEIRQKRRRLAPEMKMFLNSARRNLFSRLTEFFAVARSVLKKTWKPHLLAIIAVTVRYVNFFLSKDNQIGWSAGIALILVIVSFFWLVSELRKD